jgi:hypothetical protein
MTSRIESLADSFNKLWLEDPIIKALQNGTMAWGDIPEIVDEIYSSASTYTSTYTPVSRGRSPIRTPHTFRSISRSSSASSYRTPGRSISPSPTRYSSPVPDSRYNPRNRDKSPLHEPVVPPFTPGVCTIMAKNLPRDISTQELRYIFEKYGPIRDIYIPKNMDKSSPYFGTIKGFAKIQFISSEHSALAYTSEYARITIRSKQIALEFAKQDR